MKKTLLVVSLFALLMAAGPARGEYISSISGTDIDAVFASGQLTLSDTIELVIQYEGGTQTPISNAVFALTAELFADNSSGGVASGLFNNGTLLITAADSTVLLSGVLQELALESLSEGMLLGGSGVVTLDAGSLKSDIAPGYEFGELVSILFQIEPSPVYDFSSDFSGRANLTILPIPEPATMLLLGLGGGAGLIGRKRR